MYNSHIIANCLQSVPAKIFKNLSIIGKDMDKSKVPRFLSAYPVVIISSSFPPLVTEMQQVVTGLIQCYSYTSVFQ